MPEVKIPSFLMTISYKWLLDYLPVELDPENISSILNSIGLEVEKLEKYEEVKGGLEGLVIGEVLHTEKHPNADKLTLTRVNIGSGEPLSIVCGAPNVAAGQKVLVAPVGATIYPITGDPLTMRVAKIRGTESYGMICAEDEVGLGSSHDGIMVLDPSAIPGTSAAEYFAPYEDHIFEIGLTPNRSDAMSHLGVARDICAYLSHHEHKTYTVRSPYPKEELKPSEDRLNITVSVEDAKGCPRYSGLALTGVKIAPSPAWLAKKLKAAGLRPINNIVDITNFVLHETGQPLHAFDADRISNAAVIVKKLPSGTSFLSLDDKERKLDSDDLIICGGNSEPMCIAGVFGGKYSGVTDSTTNIFLESAFFDPGMIRRTSFRHNLRTDAATHFEKGIDIGNTVNVLKRAAQLIIEHAGGQIASGIIDVYPQPAEQKTITTSYSYLRKISGKAYDAETVKDVLLSLGFGIDKETAEEITVRVPLHKTDVSLPADIAEEVMRIDGFDNIAIPASITITPSTEENLLQPALKEKISNVLAGMGFFEIMNNSITNSAFLTEEESATAVKMMNNLSAELDSLRVSMLETGLQTVLHNLNRKNNNLRLFEFGKTYSTSGPGNYNEVEHLALFVSGRTRDENWHNKKETADIYYLKGVVQALLTQLGIMDTVFETAENNRLEEHLQVRSGNTVIANIGRVNGALISRFDIKQEVYVADVLWENCTKLAEKTRLSYKEIPRFPAVQRDLAFVVDRHLIYSKVEETVKLTRIPRLKQINLFDVFESEKLGAGKKSMALSFTFLDEEKTLTDKDIDEMMQKIIVTFEKELNAEIRKA
ncbi:MAG TPA: phenylalanine--tRNA ligase subunit beta [Chitinophagaceae bacterium]|nr:phenylalanine--tRNA ligase subunit beta [Chitinophagaceae bacterium]